MVYFEKCKSLVFLSSYFENAWYKLGEKEEGKVVHVLFTETFTHPG
jgi:hypothetical protein